MKNNFFRFIILIFAFVAVIGLLVGVSKATAGGGSGSDTSSKNDDITIVPESTDSLESEVIEPEETEEGHIHEYGDPVVSKEATCVAVGEQKSTCIACGAIKIEGIPKLKNHSYNTSGVCELCGSECKHEWSAFEVDITNRSNHVRKCSLCRTRDSQAHNLVNGVCQVCRFKCNHDFETIYFNVLGYTPYNHTYEAKYRCKICGDIFDSGDADPHDLVNGSCKICGFSESNSCSHMNCGWEVGDYSPYSPLGNGSHQTSYKYVCYDCNAIIDTEERIEPCMVPGSSGYCDWCGYYYDSGNHGSGLDPDCSHNNISTSGDGCWSYDFCLDCGGTVSTSHTGFEDLDGDNNCDICGSQ